MALQLATALIETRGACKLQKLEAAMEKALADLGWERTFEGKEALTPDPGDGAIGFVLLANEDGAAGIQVDDEKVVRDLARIVSERVDVALLLLLTTGSLFGRRSVEVVCRKFEFRSGSSSELAVMAAHTRDVSDVEHNELRQADNALRSRINNANESLLRAEGTAGFKPKKFFRYKRNLQPVKFSSPRLARLMEQIEACESYEIDGKGPQPIVKLVLAGGAKSMSYLKTDEVAELEKALASRPELVRRKVS
ncbi:MAG: hypothetical protein U0168_15275 [Nannocystaceae bacterium]